MTYNIDMLKSRLSKEDQKRLAESGFGDSFYKIDKDPENYKKFKLKSRLSKENRKQIEPRLEGLFEEIDTDPENYKKFRP